MRSAIYRRPVKIVHHTTEGSSYAGAKAAYKANKSDPHFTVVGDDIFQHIDTSLAARSLKNLTGGVQTNRDSAVQIEVVGFAAVPKDIATLHSVGKLCRWIEDEHGVPQRWPNGKPRTSTTGGDPGGHNRNAVNWDSESGHYGHSQVPENVHWDPGYSAAELAIVTPAAIFDSHDELGTATTPMPPTPESAPAPADGTETIVDVVVARILAGLASNAALALGRPPTRISVHVAVGGIAVDVVVEAKGEDVAESHEIASSRGSDGTPRKRARKRAGGTSRTPRRRR